jgi:tyrosinase
LDSYFAKALTPFHLNAAGDFWTSTLSRNIETFGYSYPELIGHPSNSSLVAQIKTLYAGPANGGTTTKLRRDQASKESTRAYLAQVTMPLYGLGEGSPYNVLIFVGDVTGEAKDWLSLDTFAGISATLGGANMNSDQKATTTVDITSSVENAIAKGSIKDNSLEAVTKYLKEQMRWRIELVSPYFQNTLRAGPLLTNRQGGKEFAPDSVKGLEVKLLSTAVEIGSEDRFDRWVGGFADHGVVES